MPSVRFELYSQVLVRGLKSALTSKIASRGITPDSAIFRQIVPRMCPRGELEPARFGQRNEKPRQEGCQAPGGVRLVPGSRYALAQ